MPNLTVAERKQRETQSDLLKAIGSQGLTDKYYLDQVDEYMNLYSNLAEINRKLGEKFNADLLKEKRQVLKEMRSILTFLGLKPNAGIGDGYSEEL